MYEEIMSKTYSDLQLVGRSCRERLWYSLRLSEAKAYDIWWG